MNLKHLWGAALAALFFIAPVSTAQAYVVNTDYELGTYEGDSRLAYHNIIIAHETGNPNNTGYLAGRNEAAYMKNHYYDAYTHYIVENDGSTVYQIGEPGYVEWGAGPSANVNSPVQIELARTNNYNTFIKGYQVYVNLLRQKADEYGSPKNLDSWALQGIKSHLWTSRNWGETDHGDPIGYFAQWGISYDQFQHDIAYGVGSNAPTNKPQPTKPQPANGGTYEGFTPETGKFTVGSEAIQVRVGRPGINAPRGGKLQPGDSIRYDGFKNVDGYVWVHYKGYSGDDLFLPTHPSGTPNNLWGSFSE